VTACKLAEDAKAIDFIGTPRSQRCNNIMTKNVIAPGAARRCMPPPMAVRLAADLRPSADGSAVHTSLVASGG